MSALAELDLEQMQAEASPKHLEILARAKAALAAAVEVEVPANDVRRYEGQPRKYFNPAALTRLALSINEAGQIQSGLVRRNPGETEYELIDGERRWRAVLSLPAESRPLYKAKLIDADDDVVHFLISGIANFNREDHTPLETMDTIDRLLSFQFPMSEIAALLGISEMWAYQIHGLTNLEDSVKDLLDPMQPKERRLPITAAVQISKLDKKLQRPLAEQVLAKSVPISRLRKEVLKVSKRAGIPVRIREVDPRKRLDAAIRKSAGMARYAGDLEEMMTDARLKAHFASRKDATLEIERSLKAVRKSLAACEIFLKVCNAAAS